MALARRVRAMGGTAGDFGDAIAVHALVAIGRAGCLQLHVLLDGKDLAGSSPRPLVLDTKESVNARLAVHGFVRTDWSELGSGFYGSVCSIVSTDRFARDKNWLVRRDAG